MSTPSEALDLLSSLSEYAYSTGYHECGYCPVKVVTEEIERLRSENQRQAERIAELQRPPEGREGIAERRNFLYVACENPAQAAFEDVAILLQDAARHRNAHDVLMAERESLRAKCEALTKERDDNFQAGANSAKKRFEERAEHLRRIEQLQAALNEIAVAADGMSEGSDASERKRFLKLHGIASEALATAPTSETPNGTL